MSLNTLSSLSCALLIITMGPGCGGTTTPSGPDGGGEDASVLDASVLDASGDVLADGARVGPRIEGHDFSVSAIDGVARAGVVVDASGLLGGPKSEGRVGDVRMDNGHVAFVLSGMRRSSGYSYWGGNVIDASARRADGSWTPDHFGEIFFGWNLDIFEPSAVEVVDDGRDSGVAHVRFTGATAPFHFADSVIAGFLNLEAPELAVTYDYMLGPEDRGLTLEVTFQNDRAWFFEMEWPIAFTHFGDGAFPFSPGSGFEEFMGQWIPYHGLAGREVAYGLVSEADDLTSFFTYAGVSLVQADPFELPPKANTVRTFYLLASAQGPAGLDAGRRQVLAIDDDAQTLSGTVTMPDTASHEEAWIVVRTAEDGDVASSTPLDAAGAYTVQLTPGTYTLTPYAEHHAAGETVSVTVPTPDDTLPTTSIPLSAQVRVSVTEATTGQPTPARVTFLRTGETPSAFAPSNVRPVQKTWSGDRSAVAYVTADEEMVTLPPGTYQVTASRGPTHEIDQRLLTFAVGEVTEIAMSVEQVIDTTGWMSGDFHIHALWSPDSYVPWTIRARQAATEDLDLPILTEHVYIGGLQSAVDETGVGDHVVGVVGQEITSFTHGHFNAFPLEWKADTPNHGAVFPYDKGAVALFEAIRSQHDGDEIIQINHPRGSNISAYFSYVGLNAEEDQVTNTANWSTDWDAIEVFNGGCSGGTPLADWVGLTNHGHRKTLAGGSDSHGEHGLIGTPRNWIQVDEASVRADHQALVAPIRSRRLVVSCGPFVRFTAVNAAGEVIASLGDVAPVDATGNVTFRVVVEAPTWMTVNEVRLWENGQVVRVEDITASADPVRRYDDVWTVTPSADAWYSVEVVGSGSMAPITWSGPPYALTNPIEVDADGDGDWTPPGM